MATPGTSDKPYWKLQVTCPSCGLAGTLSWDRVSAKRRVRCSRCGQWFRIEPQGAAAKTEKPDTAITVAARGALSGWQEHLAPESGRWERRAKRSTSEGWSGPFGWRTTTIIGAVLVGLATTGLLSLRGTAADSAAAAYAEPERLDERATEFTAAWAGHSMPGMVRFTEPGKSSPLMSWVGAATLAPAFVEAEIGDVSAAVVSVEPRKDSHQALVTVRIAHRAAKEPPPKTASGYTHRQIWRELDGKWFFAPEETVKILSTASTVR